MAPLKPSPWHGVTSCAHRRRRYGRECSINPGVRGRLRVNGSSGFRDHDEICVDDPGWRWLPSLSLTGDANSPTYSAAKISVLGTVAPSRLLTCGREGHSASGAHNPRAYRQRRNASDSPETETSQGRGEMRSPNPLSRAKGTVNWAKAHLPCLTASCEHCGYISS